MDTKLRCQRCGGPLTGQVVGEHCANCLLGLVLGPVEECTKVVATPEPAQTNRIRYFGDYELVEEIARGGMGVVFKARQVSLNRPVALKMILAGDFSAPSMVERFRTEAEAAARLEHPNIVPIYEIGAQDGQHYFSMRYLDGGTLAQRIEKRGTEFLTEGASEVGELGLRASAHLVLKVARAVHHAHQRGILHRDLKPGNILFDQDGEPMVVDFGLAKLLEGNRSLTVGNAVLGTPGYMAPEQAAGHSEQLTTGADVYSLGVILYELLTGSRPFQGATQAEVLRQVIEIEPCKPRTVNPAVDRDLETICLKCLEKDPQRRYGSAEALADDLLRWLVNEPIQARRTSVAERVVKWARRKPAVAGLMLALHLVVVAGIAGILGQSKRANALANRASMEAANARSASARAEQELWNANLNAARAIRVAGGSGARFRSSTLLQELIQRPDLSENQTLELRQEAIAQLALADIAIPTHWTVHSGKRPLAWDSQLRRYACDAGGGRVELREYPSGKQLASFSTERAMAFEDIEMSATDQFLAVLLTDGELRVWNLATHEMVVRETNVERLAFSSDDRALMLLLKRGVAIRAMNEAGGGRLLHPNRRISRAVFSPDARWIAALPESGANQVEIWNAASGEVRGVINPDFPPRRIAWHPHGMTLALGGDRGRLELRTLAIESDISIRVGGGIPLTGHLGAIRRLGFSADGSTLFSFGWSSLSIAWDLVSLRPRILEPREFTAINADATRVAVASETTNAIATMVQPTAFRVAAYAGEPREAHGVWVSPDGRLGVVSYDATIANKEADCIVWDFHRGHEIARIKGVDAVFSPDSRSLYTFERYGANRIRYYNVSREILTNRPPRWSDGTMFYRGGHGESINSGAMATDGRTLIVAASDAVLFIDTLGVKPIRSWRKSAYYATPSADGKWVATSFNREPAVLRSVTDGMAMFRAPNEGRIRLSTDGRWLATVDKAGVQIYPFDEVPPTASHAIPIAEPGSFAFSPDNKIFAVVINSAQVRLHEIATGRELATLTPPRLAPISGARALTFSPDARWLLAAKHDGEVVAWDLVEVRRELSKMGLNWKYSESPGRL